MLQIKNTSPFQAALGLFADAEGRNLVTVAVKATLNLPAADGVCCVAQKQLPVYPVDTYWDEPATSSIRAPADLIPGKLTTDVGVVGGAHSPEGKPVRELLTGLRVGQLSKLIHVTGDRRWEKTLGVWRQSDPLPFTTMPLVYERAYGGTTKDRRHASNPVGVGLLAQEGELLPNLEDPQDRFQGRREAAVACPGFIAPSWWPRIRFVGTYDEAWQLDQCPLLPRDFDRRFFNCAAPGLVANGFLEGDEVVKMVNMSRRGTLTFVLPRLAVTLIYRFSTTTQQQRAELWTVLFDLDEERFCLTWGNTTPLGHSPSQLRGVEVRIEGLEMLRSAGSGP